MITQFLWPYDYGSFFMHVYCPCSHAILCKLVGQIKTFTLLLHALQWLKDLSLF